MEHIYHEKQEGSLCAVHCLNALLQSSYFSAVDLAELAADMDRAEQQHMAEMGTDTAEYQRFLREGSNNMDDSGMFSIQVISAALKVFTLNIIPYQVSGNQDTLIQYERSAFICNMREHWFTIRKLGFQWFNLNSLLAYPELLSDTYLSLFLAQLQNQGYVIYIVDGQLPPCKADQELKLKRASQATKPPLLSELQEQEEASTSARSSEEANIAAAVAASLSGVEPSRGSQTIQTDAEVAAAVAASLASMKEGSRTVNVEESDDDDDLERALQMSLTEHLTAVPQTSKQLTKIDIAHKESNSSTGSAFELRDAESKQEEEDLKRALELSLQTGGCPEPSPDSDTVRQKRLKYFGGDKTDGE